MEVALGRLADDLRAIVVTLQHLGLLEQAGLSEATAPAEPDRRKKRGSAGAPKPAHRAGADIGQATVELSPALVRSALERLRRQVNLLAAMDSRASARALGQQSGRNQYAGGLAIARARGEAVKLEMIRNGEIIPAKALAEGWGLTPQALGSAQKRGEVKPLVVKRQRYFPSEFLGLERDVVAEVSRALNGLSPSEHLIFWKRPHGALEGRTAADFLSRGKVGYARREVVALAEAWAREAGF